MRYLPLVLSLLLVPSAAVRADVSVGVGISVPGVSIGINVPAYPRLVRIPGYPVYYDPRIHLNLFFYDGLYWVFQGDHWYVSSWYDGPWDLVDPYDVPLFVLRVPVRYYRVAPPFFHGWRPDAPPRWGEHWGPDWERQRGGWDRWDRRAAPRPAPLPSYQRPYTGERYPREPEQQRSIRTERYRYQPREPVGREHFQQQQRPGGPQERGRDGRGDHGPDRR
ncbi:hypothetical protein [Thiobacillus sedimenti]|uniref:BcpO-related WXXGXW repeat protein n=1 Tax=Thiobacillus sedimenti TaxID=3110231 RepID=A0ABZ1CMC4_9PROT|nr:hypothetical protein [Thiobacillus sp. SCUT-2]WRS40354.1 hypothetical protein VA613_05650 [Thiobacillus sp. SCUT-2]